MEPARLITTNGIHRGRKNRTTHFTVRGSSLLVCRCKFFERKEKPHVVGSRTEGIHLVYQAFRVSIPHNEDIRLARDYESSTSRGDDNSSSSFSNSIASLEPPNSILLLYSIYLSIYHLSIYLSGRKSGVPPVRVFPRTHQNIQQLDDVISFFFFLRRRRRPCERYR